MVIVMMDVVMFATPRGSFLCVFVMTSQLEQCDALFAPTPPITSSPHLTLHVACDQIIAREFHLYRLAKPSFAPQPGACRHGPAVRLQFS